MRVLKDIFFYPWMSYQENNANAVFINGPVPTLIDPGHSHLFGSVIEAMRRDGADAGQVRFVLLTHGHPDHVEASDRLDESALRAISAKEFAFMQERIWMALSPPFAAWIPPARISSFRCVK